jgi:hypothetical protein
MYIYPCQVQVIAPNILKLKLNFKLPACAKKNALFFTGYSNNKEVFLLNMFPSIPAIWQLYTQPFIIPCRSDLPVNNNFPLA